MPAVRRRLRVATWNINSLRLRAPLLHRLLDGLRPDVLCLQETKVPDPLFPAHVPAELGFPFVAFRGMKGYNGVAILSRIPFEVQTDGPDWCSKGDCRHLAVRLDLPGTAPIELHDFYVPAGGDVPDRAENPKFGHKLDFLAEATEWFGTRTPRRAILVGDLNVAPLEQDVWSHRQLLRIVSHTPVETAALTAWLATGFTDAVRRFVPDTEKHYTWWSYRNRDWRLSDRGRRLDHVWVSHDLAPQLKRQITLKDARDWPQTSDHVPVCVEVEV